MRWTVRITGCLISIFLALTTTSGCGLFRPSFEEASQELADLVDPALKAALQGVDHTPNKLTESDNCSDPFTGPSDGLRPTLDYSIPLAALGSNPESFVERAERAWEEAGLKVQRDRSETADHRFSGRDGYALQAMVNYANNEAIIGGTGPCVDNPNPD